MSYIKVENLKKNYKVINRKKGFFKTIYNFFIPDYKKIEAVKNINFSIDEGESVGFIGPNGAGKSTTVKMLTGILVPSSGKIEIDNLSPFKDRKKHVKHIGAVFGQRTQLWYDLPVIDTLELLRYIYKIEKNQYKKNMKLFNELLDIHEFINQPVRQLSLGQRMRADIAAALLHNPKCIFLDEPTIGLDVVVKEKIRSFIKYINNEENKTILFTTHDMQDIEKICRRIIIIDKGAIIYDGPIDNIKAKFGKERNIIVEFAEYYHSPKIEGTTLEQLKGNKVKLSYNIDKIKTQKIIADITNNYKIHDLIINEPEIESIIRQIYQGGI